MVIHVTSVAFSGIDVTNVDVQLQISPGMPSFAIVGLADKTISESKERVRAALNSFGLSLPAKKILVNLAPADLLKEGSHFDLAIAAAILAGSGILPIDHIIEFLILGELSLDGSILPVSGVLPTAIAANASGKGIICPHQNAREAAWSANDRIIGPNNLLELVNHFKGSQLLAAPEIMPSFDQNQMTYPDIADIRGQDVAKRTLEISASGGHNLLMFGAPGTGKSMLAQAIPGILPPMSSTEILECSIISSIAGLINDGKLSYNRPFRAPHHSCSVAAMVGGGMARKVKPGEISLAHNGVLFLDELPEFPKVVIDSLRQPIETGSVLISRVNSHVRYPANFQLIAAMNPCKCGYIEDLDRACKKAPICAQEYQLKISGPIMDRFDIHVSVPAIQNYGVTNYKQEEKSVEVAKRVLAARNIQKQRYAKYNITCNNRLDGQALIEFATPTSQAKKLLDDAANKFKLSMRAYNRIIRVSRTIADMAQDQVIDKIHLAEALNYRQMDYKLNTKSCI